MVNSSGYREIQILEGTIGRLISENFMRDPPFQLRESKFDNIRYYYYSQIKNCCSSFLVYVFLLFWILRHTVLFSRSNCEIMCPQIREPTNCQLWHLMAQQIVPSVAQFSIYEMNPSRSEYEENMGHSVV